MDHGAIAMTRGRLAALLFVLGLGAFLLSGLANGQQLIHRNGFELLKTGWSKGGYDTPYEEKDHSLTDRVANTGRFSEHILLDVKPAPKEGGFIYYAYPVGKALV